MTCCFATTPARPDCGFPWRAANQRPPPRPVRTGRRLEAAGNGSAWVWDCEVHSQFAANGAADHVVSYRIQNAGSRQVRLKLPVGLAPRDVHGIILRTRERKPASPGKPLASAPAESEVHDKPVAAVSGTGPAAGELTVDLPADLNDVTLVLQISTRGEPLGIFNRLGPPLPDIGLPVFARHWWLELPPGYATCRYDQDPQVAGSTSFSLRRCLLGWLERGGDQSVFNPLSRKDWESALPWRRTEDRPAGPGTAAKTAGWTQFPIDPAEGARERDRDPPRGNRRRKLAALSGRRRHRGLGPLPPPFRLVDGGGRAGPSRLAAAGGNRDHFFPRPVGGGVLPAARTVAAAHDRGWRGGLESPRGDAQHPDRNRSLRRAIACRRDALRLELGRGGRDGPIAAGSPFGIHPRRRETAADPWQVTSCPNLSSPSFTAAPHCRPKSRRAG